MHSTVSWHASGLRWIGSLFNDAADFLERPSPTASEPGELWHAPDEEMLDETRHRMRLLANL